MHALVISGGGSKGAFGGGIADYLIRQKKRNYEILVGTSTGSLLIPQLSIGNIDEIKSTFTSVTQEDIYNVNPFKITKSVSQRTTRINHPNILKMFLKHKKTFGDHQNLLRTIRNTISPEEYELVKMSSKKVIISVANFSLNTIEYKYASDWEYEDFTEWMWASSSFVPFMGIVEKNGYEYADGGFGSQVPIDEALNAGATKVDVIILAPRYTLPAKQTTNNAFDVLLRAMDFMHQRIARENIYNGHLQSVYNRDLTVNFIFTPRALTEHSFIFDPTEMSAWWNEGKQYAERLDLEGYFDRTE